MPRQWRESLANIMKFYSYGDSSGLTPDSLFIHSKLEPYIETKVYFYLRE